MELHHYLFADWTFLNLKPSLSCFCPWRQSARRRPGPPASDCSLLKVFLHSTRLPKEHGFLLANTQSAASLHNVPYGASRSILLKILDFWGRFEENWIFINFSGLEDMLHYCNKSRDIFIIVGIHLLRSLHVSFWSATTNLSPFFYPLNTIFILRLREHVNHLCFLLVAFSVKLSERSRIYFTSFSVKI